MGRQEDVFSFGCTRIAVGLSLLHTVNLATMPGSISVQFKKISGASLEIVSGVSSLSNPAAARGTGYLLGENEIMSIGGPATFYLCATGLTCVLSLLIGQSQGTV